MKTGLPSVGETGGDTVRSIELFALALLLVARDRSGDIVDMSTLLDDVDRPRLPPNNGSVNLLCSFSAYWRVKEKT